TNSSTPTVTGTAEPGSAVTVYDGSAALGTATADGSGTWSYTTPPLADGSHDLTFTTTDAAGNTSSSADLAITVDTQAPAAPGGLALSTGGSVSSSSTPTVTGTAEPGSTVTVYDTFGGTTTRLG